MVATTAVPRKDILAWDPVWDDSPVLRAERRCRHLMHSLVAVLGARASLPIAALPGAVFGNRYSLSP